MAIRWFYSLVNPLINATDSIPFYLKLLGYESDHVSLHLPSNGATQCGWP